MTELLNRAFRRAAQLPPEAQDELARQLLDELASEEQWSTAFENSPQALSELADEAIAENAAEQTKALDPDRL